MSEYEQKLWDDRSELEIKYKEAQAKIKDLEEMGTVKQRMRFAARIEKLEQANKIMLEALKEIYKTNINGANIYSGAEDMQFDAKEAINQVKEMLGE